ncbi:MAG TPA: phytanoyl-CoA dioxygenase family protein [Kiloniellaceae bacterium]|nr:phytanoyl-CoA dioxygenase family protein [Kiloniellaceae bacterium]
MTPEDVLSHPPKVLSQEQREFYFANGYLLLERFVSEDWLGRLKAATEEMVERSRQVTKSDQVWDLEPGHSAEAPRLRRLSSPNDHHPTYWAFASESTLADAIADLVGPDVKFHHSKLNFKWAGGGEEVKWHQDIQFWPHTNYSPLTAGLYLQDCDMDQGPLGVMAGSHEGPLYDQYDAAGNWTGCLSDSDARALDPAKAVYLPGPAGSVTIHNCRTIHGSRANSSNQGRPLLLNVYSAADAMPYTGNPLYSKYDQSVVRGQAARWAHHDPRPCLLPPDWRGGYKSIFTYQQKEDDAVATSAGA